jgi:hypothetical protein
VELFKTPTVKGLEGYIKKEASEEKYNPLKAVEAKEYYPLSSAQKRLYILQQMEEKPTAYNIPTVVTAEGDLDKNRMENAFKKLVDRHESLRTTFEVIANEPVQRIHDRMDIELEIEYYGVEEEKQAAISAFIRPFDLSQPPLVRMGLIKVEENQYILMMDMHHIITDGVSYGILTKDLMVLYAANELPSLPIQYKDYSEWQNSEKESESFKRQENYWLNEFKGEVPVLNLPTDYMRPPFQSFEGDTAYFKIGREDTGKLNALAKENDVTLYMILLAIFNVLLAKLSGNEDIAIGTPTAGRRHADLEPIIGMFVNTLALRSFPVGEKPFSGYLQEVKQKALDAFENQDYPFEELVDRVEIKRDTTRNPLFDALFVLQNYQVDTIEIPGLKLLPYDFEAGISKFDLSLFGMEVEDLLHFSIEYCTRLFREETIERFIKYYKKIICSVSQNNGQKISEIDIMPEEERAIILYLFNDTESLYPRNKTIHELFAEQAAKTPDNTAVVFYDPGTQSGVSINYRDLHRKSNQMARVLQAEGVTSDSIVGILAKKSVEMVIGILGILKAGGAYLPLDPDYPNERKEYIMDDCSAQILLTNLREPIDFASMVIHLDDSEIYKNNDDFSRDYSRDHLAYIMYTSGSTGTPKGVMVAHRNVVRLVKNTNFLDFNEEHRILQSGALEFDASTFEIWGALLNGSSL